MWHRICDKRQSHIMTYSIEGDDDGDINIGAMQREKNEDRSAPCHES